MRRSDWATALARAPYTTGRAPPRATVVAKEDPAAAQQRHRSVSALVKMHLLNGDAEEALRAYRIGLFAGAPVSPGADGAAVQALQKLGTSQWHSTRQILRLTAAEKGIDVDTGYSISRLTSRDARQHHGFFHPAWNVRIKEASPEERLHLRVEHDLMTMESAIVLWSPHRVAHLAMSYSLYQLQRTCHDGTLRACVQPWTLSAIVHPLLTNRAPVEVRGVIENKCGISNINGLPLNSVAQRQQLAANGHFRDRMHARLADLERQLPRFDADTSVLAHLCSVCSHLDELFLGRLAAVLFQLGAHRSNGHYCALPNHLTPEQLFTIIPPITPTFPPVHGLHLRLEKIAERTMRSDVSQGVLVPDVDAIANQFDRLVSLSQHREVLIPFRVLLTLVMLASPESNDWRKYRIREHLRQLLQSLTTDAHLLADRQAQRSPKHGAHCDPPFSLGGNTGGVTVLGVLDELAILQTHCKASSTAQPTTTLHESIAWTAKHIGLCRQNIAAGECRHDRAAALRDPLSILLSGFGVLGNTKSRSSGQLKEGPSVGYASNKALKGTDVVVVSQSRAVHDACFAIGVPVMA